MEAKYPGNYFERYIISYDTSGTEPNKSGFENLARLFIEIEGLEEFTRLIDEIKAIDRNNDWIHFESIALESNVDLDKDRLKEMAYITVDMFNFLNRAEGVTSNDIDIDDNYIDKIVEWQDHQYNPGYYTVGKIPPVLTNPGKPRWLGWTFIISGALVLLIMFFVFAMSFDIKQILEMVIAFVFIGGISILQISAGVRYLKSNPVNRTQLQKRRLLKVRITCLIILCLIVGGYITAVKTTERVEGYDFEGNSKVVFYTNSSLLNTTRYSVKLEDLNRDIVCSKEEFWRLNRLVMDSHDKGGKVVIRYKWSPISQSASLLEIKIQ